MRRSKDPSTKVGAVLTRGNHIISIGYNGFPKGIADTAERLNDRELKNKLVVHAEENAICIAARCGHSTEGTTLYVAACNAAGDAVWGGPPCHRCLVSALQAGVTEFVGRPRKLTPTRWQESLQLSFDLIKEAGVLYREVDFPKKPELWCHPDAELHCPHERYRDVRTMETIDRCATCPLGRIL